MTYHMGHKCFGDSVCICAAANLLHSKTGEIIEVNFWEPFKDIAKWFDGVSWVSGSGTDVGGEPSPGEWDKHNGVSRFYRFMDDDFELNQCRINFNFDSVGDKYVAISTHSNKNGDINLSTLKSMIGLAKEKHGDKEFVFVGHMDNKLPSLDFDIKDMRTTDRSGLVVLNTMRESCLVIGPHNGLMYVPIGLGIETWCEKSKISDHDFCLNINNGVRWFDRPAEPRLKPKPRSAVSTIQKEKLVNLFSKTDGPIVELGVDWGLTTKYLAEKFPDRKIVGIDLWDESSKKLPDNNIYSANFKYDYVMNAVGGMPNVEIIRGDATFMAFDSKVGGVFIDIDKGDVDLIAAACNNWLPKLSENGIMVAHDLHDRAFKIGLSRCLPWFNNEFNMAIYDPSSQEYDIEFVLPVCNKGKYANRTKEFFEYGLINVDCRIFINVLTTNDDESNYDYIDFDHKVHKYELDNQNYKLCKFLMNNNNYRRSRWFFKLDDDSANDVGSLYKSLCGYDHTDLLYLTCTRVFDCDAVLKELLVKYLPKEKIGIGNRYYHEWEASIISSPALELMRNKAKDFFLEVIGHYENTNRKIFSDHTWALGAKISGVPIIAHPELCSWSYLDGFSLFTNKEKRYCHIHNIASDKPKWQEYLRLYQNCGRIWSNSV